MSSVGVAQLSTLGHEMLLRSFESDWRAEIFESSDFGEYGGRHFGRRTARADLSATGKCGSLSEVRRGFLSDSFMKIHETWPNKSLEPTPVTPSACREVTRWRISAAAWLSFFR